VGIFFCAHPIWARNGTEAQGIYFYAFNIKKVLKPPKLFGKIFGQSKKNIILKQYYHTEMASEHGTCRSKNK